jgi:hypothetical protein
VTAPAVGDRVRIERDETKYPSKGTWPYYRGKTGTVVEINLGEYGVVFTKVTPRIDGRGRFRYKSEDVHWMQPWEVSPIGGTGSESLPSSGYRPSEGASTGEALVHA